MSARALLQLLLLAQGVTVALLAWGALALGLVASPWLAAGFGAGVVLLVRLLITANSFVMSARYASATPQQFRLDAAARVRLFCAEFMASLLHSSWFMARAAPRQRIYPDATLAPVLLLHGYGCNSGYWAHLTPLLEAARISHATLDLEPLMAGIDDYVPLVQRAALALCEASGAPRVTIVAHSMGGLVARAWLRVHGSARAARVITLGTPHHGTSLAQFGPGRNAAQMQRASGAAPESAWLRALAASETAATRALITSLYTHHDNIVSPQSSGALEGARNVAFGGVGHVALGSDAQVLACVMGELARPCNA
ncbi:MAG: alpha/beta fold hydrolase [Pseudomonadota bacterium]